MGLVEFKSWLAKGDYRVADLNDAGGLTLHVPNRTPMVESYSYDFARFTCAACESTRGIGADIEFPRATAWASIRLYYSAFFAAHAILRYLGVSCSQVDNEQATKVTKYANTIYEIEGRMQAGFYSATFSPGSSDIVMVKFSESHKDTWKCFKSALAVLRERVLAGNGLTAEKLRISSLIEDLLSAISLDGATGGNWLSVYRNAVNYRQAYEAWYPYKKTSLEYSDISKFTDGWRSDFNCSAALQEDDRRVKFFGACAVILFLMRQLALDLKDHSSRSSIHCTRTARLLKA